MPRTTAHFLRSILSNPLKDGRICISGPAEVPCNVHHCPSLGVHHAGARAISAAAAARSPLRTAS